MAGREAIQGSAGSEGMLPSKCVIVRMLMLDVTKPDKVRAPRKPSTKRKAATKPNGTAKYVV